MKTETQTEHVGSYRTPDGKAQIDWTIRNIGDKPEFSASGNYNGSAGQCLAEIFSAYGNDATVRRLYRLWQAHHLKELPPGALESLLEIKSNAHESFYEHQAQTFLDRFGIKFRATLSDSKVAAWAKDGKHGHHYRVTLSKGDGKPQRVRNFGESKRPNRVVFDFWASIADAQKGIKTVTPYDVLACISSDTYCPDTFKEWAGEFGESTDSIKALQTYGRCSAFAKRLQAFFTAEEIEALQEIQ